MFDLMVALEKRSKRSALGGSLIFQFVPDEGCCALQVLDLVLKK